MEEEEEEELKDDREHGREENREREPEELVQTYKNKFTGHYSSNTIKGVAFYGPNSEYVMSGSDDACIYIWERKTAKLLRILQGHESIVNCIVGNPHQPMIASSGIDKVIKLWENTGDFPSEEELEERRREMEEITTQNGSGQRRETMHLEDMCVQQ
eukprot:TRINITY_DN1366_c0_g1_i2.p2 TRINITY_DN1366_c0_g1~~TRINITY_DN1366_c0_g1_i2.p2  ORF type:complete len:157 (+),score=41.82 TRINITY_DN1366_c0_g1_i2:1464-1934(+)